jgi:hypothetical protein
MFHGSSDDLFAFYGSSSPIILPVEFVIFPAIESLIIPSEVNLFTVYWYALLGCANPLCNPEIHSTDIPRSLWNSVISDL